MARGRRGVRVCVEIGTDLYEALREAFGRVDVGVQRILEGWAWAHLGPRDGRLRRAWEALRERGRRLALREALRVVAAAVGTDERGAWRVLQELGSLGYVVFVEPGVVEVVYGGIPEEARVLMMLGLLRR